MSTVEVDSCKAFKRKGMSLKGGRPVPDEAISWTFISCQGTTQAENNYLHRVTVLAVQASILPESEAATDK